ncbi:MAG: dockerin type I domain-containing protein [Planctomycetota bacterium]
MSDFGRGGRRRLGFQLLSKRLLLAADWNNPSNAADVNDDDRVSALDALMVINHINAMDAGGQSAPGLGTEFYPDANADGSVTALDALTVINRIASGEGDVGARPDLTLANIQPFPTPADGVVTGLTSFLVEIENEGAPFDEMTPVTTSVTVVGEGITSQQTALLRTDETLDQSLLTIDNRFGELPNGIYDLQFEVAADGVTEDDPDDNVELFEDSLRVVDGTVEFSPLGFDAIVDPVVPPDGDSLLDFAGLRKFEVDEDIEIDLVANDLTIEISTPGPGLIRISTLGLFPDVDVPLSEDLEIEAGGFGNTIIFNSAVIPEDLEIDLRGGGHTVRFVDTLIGDDFDFDGSGGFDTIVMEDFTFVADDVDIETGSGDDILIIRDTSIGDDLEVDMGHGFDAMIIDFASVGDDIDVEMGDGDDNVWASQIFAGDEIEVEGEDEFDILAVDRASIVTQELEVEEFEEEVARTERATIDEVLTALGLPLVV